MVLLILTHILFIAAIFVMEWSSTWFITESPICTQPYILLDVDTHKLIRDFLRFVLWCINKQISEHIHKTFYVKIIIGMQWKSTHDHCVIAIFMGRLSEYVRNAHSRLKMWFYLSNKNFSKRSLRLTRRLSMTNEKIRVKLCASMAV